MRHGRKGYKLSRTHAHRQATLAALSNALIEHKRIRTTLTKAKALRIYVEPLITRSKNDTTHNRRQVFRYLQNKESIKELFGEISERVAERNGGYTRVVRLGQRTGDGAEMAVIELVDYNESEPETTSRRRTRRSRRRRGKEAAAPAAAEAAAETPVDEVAEDVEEAGVVETLKDAAEDAIETVEDMVEGAAETISETVEEIVEELADEAAEAEAVEEAAEVVDAEAPADEVLEAPAEEGAPAPPEAETEEPEGDVAEEPEAETEQPEGDDAASPEASAEERDEDEEKKEE